MAQFDINIFGTSNDSLSLNNFEFILHIIQVTPSISITDFVMIIEFYAASWDVVPSGGRISPTGGAPDRVLNGRPNYIVLTDYVPTTLPTLNSDCNTTPPAGTCPNGVDIRLFSAAYKVPIIGSGYDPNETDMIDGVGNIDQLPANFTIIADGCKYTGSGNINIYNDYNNAGGLFGSSTSNPGSKVIGEDEIITIN